MRLAALLLIMLPYASCAQAQDFPTYYDPFAAQPATQRLDVLERRLDRERQERVDAIARAERQRREDQLNLRLEMIDRDFERSLGVR